MWNDVISFLPLKQSPLITFHVIHVFQKEEMPFISLGETLNENWQFKGLRLPFQIKLLFIFSLRRCVSFILLISLLFWLWFHLNLVKHFVSLFWLCHVALILSLYNLLSLITCLSAVLHLFTTSMLLLKGGRGIALSFECQCRWLKLKDLISLEPASTYAS